MSQKQKPKPLTAAEVEAVVKRLPAGYVSKPKKGATKKGFSFDPASWASLIQVILQIWQSLHPPKPPVEPPVDPPPVDPPVCPPGYSWDATKGRCVQDPVDPPPVDPPPVDPPPAECVRPDGIKLGFRDARKINPGFRNTFNVTPTINGVPAPEGCGSYYFETFGEPQAFQSLVGGFQNDPVERASGDSYGCILVLATNSEELWKNGEYQEAGKMTIGVSYPWLRTWRCQDVVMGVDGKITGAGNNSQSYDRPK